MSKYNPNIHHRRSIRLKGYDYSQAGIYFITICCKDRICHFGKIINGKMILNDGGKIAHQCWLDIPQHFPHVVLHEFVIMPNHMHGVIELVVANNNSPISDDNRGTIDIGIGAKNLSPVPANINLPIYDKNWENNDPPPSDAGKNNSPMPRSPSKTIGSLVRGFKIGVTKWFRSNTDIDNIWQRNYHEHIIRNEQSYQRISAYILHNPLNWQMDKFWR